MQFVKSCWEKFQGNPMMRRRMMFVVAFMGVAAASYVWGRYGGAARVSAQVNQVGGTPGAKLADYHSRIVAKIYGSIPVTREELGEFLIARYGAKHLDYLINRKIIEHACQQQKIDVTDAEVEAQLDEDLRTFSKGFGQHLSRDEFANQILKKKGTTLFEWREDVVRPKLLMTKLVRPTVIVTEKDLREGYDARYGPRVQVRMIVIERDNVHKDKIWKEVFDDRAKFKEFARSQFIPNLASTEGIVPPIHKHFGDAKIERAAFGLKEGDISPLMQLQDGTHVIMMCEKHLLADISKRFEDERMKLSQEIAEQKLSQRVAEVLQQLRAQATPEAYLPTPNQVARVQNPAPVPEVPPGIMQPTVPRAN